MCRVTARNLYQVVAVLQHFICHASIAGLHWLSTRQHSCVAVSSHFSTPFIHKPSNASALSGAFTLSDMARRPAPVSAPSAISSVIWSFTAWLSSCPAVRPTVVSAVAKASGFHLPGPPPLAGPITLNAVASLIGALITPSCLITSPVPRW